MMTEHDIRKTALDWVIAQEAGLDGAETAALRAWLDESPEHLEEFELCRDLYRAPELDEVLAGFTTDPVEEQSDSAITAGPSRWWTTWRGATAGLAVAASVMLAFVIGVPSLNSSSRPAVSDIVLAYDTARGETRDVTLPDDSVIRLSADSAVRVRLTAGQRQVHLDRGEAYFDVASDATRPFMVVAGSQIVRVLGTRFNIDRQRDVFELSVYEGRVQLFEPGEASADAPVFTRATRVTQPHGGERVVTALPGVDEPDWMQGWFETELITLTRLEEELQRYSSREIEFDESLSDLTLSGRFRLDQPVEVLNNLALLYDLQLEENEQTIQLRSRD
ncbi:FecR family protein [Maricaulis sp. D1M11]|uniref:FecR family protein n=1 Tax=Maricaulis sp. D1M11 TaxID=3076117 RepID=UPI0039B44723